MTDPEDRAERNRPELSILTVHYRSDQYRPKLVETVSKFTGYHEHLEHSNDVENIGFSKANNLLLRKSKGEFVILLNPDSQVTPNWADRLIDTAKEEENIGIVAPKIIQLDGRLASTGHDYSRWPYTISDRGHGEQDFRQYDTQTELRSCNFGCALIKRSLIKQIGLLDERFFLYYEDVEYCHRAKKEDWRVVYCPESIVYHQGQGSGHNKWVDESRRYVPYVLRKYYPKQELAKWYIHKAKATVAGLRNKDFVYASSNLRAMIQGVW